MPPVIPATLGSHRADVEAVAFDPSRRSAGPSRPRHVRCGLALGLIVAACSISSRAQTFAYPREFVSNSLSDSIAVADFNGDARLDLLLVSGYDGVMFNNATVLGNAMQLAPRVPRFGRPQMFAVDTLPYMAIAQDLNGDGSPDIVTINRESISVLMNTHEFPMRQATFASQQVFSAGGLPSAIASADFNGDGTPDLVIANQDDNTVSILLNETASGSPAATFAAQQVLPVGLQPAAVAVADINEDGKPDLIVGNQGDGTVDIRLNTTPAFAAVASFSPPTSLVLISGPFRIGVLDVNGDNKPDLMVADYWARSWVFVNTTEPGSAAPTFGPEHPLGIDALSFAACDVSRDGKPDIVGISGQHSWVWVLTNETARNATEAAFAPLQILQASEHSIGTACADVNGDSRADLLVTDQVDMHAYVFTNTTRDDNMFANGFD